MTERENVQAVTFDKRPMLQWDTNTAMAVIVLGAFIGLAVLRGTLATGGAVQP